MIQRKKARTEIREAGQRKRSGSCERIKVLSRRYFDIEYPPVALWTQTACVCDQACAGNSSIWNQSQVTTGTISRARALGFGCSVYPCVNIWWLNFHRFRVKTLTWCSQGRIWKGGGAAHAPRNSFLVVINVGWWFVRFKHYTMSQIKEKQTK